MMESGEGSISDPGAGCGAAPHPHPQVSLSPVGLLPAQQEERESVPGTGGLWRGQAGYPPALPIIV